MHDYITAFVTLFVIVDPIGLAPVFIAMTRGMAPAQRRRVGIRACIAAAGLLTLFGLSGEAILSGVGISMPAFRIAGGLLLFVTAFDMLFERRTQRREGQADGGGSSEAPAEHDDPSIFPLATPLIAGPGALVTMILLTGQAGGRTISHIAAIHGVMLAVIACVMAFFLLAGPIERLLGRTGTIVVTRLLGMLLAALAVQFVLDGLRGAAIVPALPAGR